jgi:uncharacterized ParB-like nuclease family protein
VDAHPINVLVGWLARQQGSIATGKVGMSERTVDTNELRRQIAAGEYKLDARAIAEAMLGRAEREFPASLRSEVLEAGELDGPAGSVD